MTESAVWKAIDPSTGEVFAEIKGTPLDEVPNLYERAHQGFNSWSTLSLEARVSYLKKLRIHLNGHLDDVVDAIHKSTGKVPLEALTNEVLPVLNMIEYIEKNARKVLGIQPKPTPLILKGKSSHVEYVARGTVLVISPSNYPFHLAMVPVLNALVAGNTVILKTSEAVPYMGQYIEELFYEVGFPDDVLQAAHGDGDLGQALIAEQPDYIFFTGSDTTGRKIAEAAGSNLIPLTLELGGKDPMLVFADANIPRAVRGAAWGAFTNSGQVCMSVERLYVEASIYDRFLEQLVEFTESLVPGGDPDADLGAMTSMQEVKLVEELLLDALAKGARLVTGLPPEEWNFDNGRYLKPMILTDVTADMRIAKEEAFGPLLAVMAFDNERQAVQLANDSRFGLNASVWSSDLEKARRVASRLVCGGVLINDVILTVANPNLPFGGAKDSGIGRYQAEIGLRIFCHEKAVMVDQGRRQQEISWFPYIGKYPKFKQLCQALFGRYRNWPALLVAYLKLKQKR